MSDDVIATPSPRRKSMAENHEAFKNWAAGIQSYVIAFSGARRRSVDLVHVS